MSVGGVSSASAVVDDARNTLQVAFQVTKEAHDDGLLNEDEFEATVQELKATFRMQLRGHGALAHLSEDQVAQLEASAFNPSQEQNMMEMMSTLDNASSAPSLGGFDETKSMAETIASSAAPPIPWSRIGRPTPPASISEDYSRPAHPPLAALERVHFDPLTLAANPTALLAQSGRSQPNVSSAPPDRDGLLPLPFKLQSKASPKPEPQPSPKAEPPPSTFQGAWVKSSATADDAADAPASKAPAPTLAAPTAPVGAPPPQASAPMPAAGAMPPQARAPLPAAPTVVVQQYEGLPTRPSRALQQLPYLAATHGLVAIGCLVAVCLLCSDEMVVYTTIASGISLGLLAVLLVVSAANRQTNRLLPCILTLFGISIASGSFVFASVSKLALACDVKLSTSGDCADTRLLVMYLVGAVYMVAGVFLSVPMAVSVLRLEIEQSYVRLSTKSGSHYKLDNL